MLPLGQSGAAISCVLCGLRVGVGAGAGKLRARTRISQPSYRPMALPTLLDLISCFRLRYCRFADLPRRPACRRMLWELERTADRYCSRSLFTLPYGYHYCY